MAATTTDTSDENLTLTILYDKPEKRKSIVANSLNTPIREATPINIVRQGNLNKKCTGCGHKNKKCTCARAEQKGGK